MSATAAFPALEKLMHRELERFRDEHPRSAEPSEDALWVGEELARRFGLPYWQFALTATDANRFAIRLARAITGRRKILVFNWCYHGTVDETFATLVDGQVREREGTLGAPVEPA